MALKKELNLLTLTLYGVGVILGAGIYALIASGAAFAGNMIWFSFLIAMFIAVFTGLSYAELTSMFPKEAAEYVYTKHAFRKERLSFLVGWILVATGIVSVAVVALAFGGYLSHMIGGSATVYAVILIALLSVLNYIGIKESSYFNDFASVIEVVGLIIVIILGLFFSNNIHPVNLFELPPTGFPGIFYAVGIIFFAFIGFEYIANISEEVKDNKNTVPKAIILSIVISSLLYVLLCISVLNLISWQELASSKAPLTIAVQKIIPYAGILISVIALFATSNTVLIMLIGASRILYGISRQGSLPKIYSAISKRGTPYVSIALAGIAAITVALYGDIKLVAQLTDIGIFIVYFFVNVSLIALRSSPYKRKFTSPTFLGVPVFAFLGALASLLMLLYFDFPIWVIEFGIIILGFIVFTVYKKSRA